METVDCGINESNSQLSYDRSAQELASCKDKDFSFEIKPSGDGNAVGVFEIRKAGEVVRRNTSKPFAKNALAKPKLDINKQNCNVTLKNVEGLKLKEYF